MISKKSFFLVKLLTLSLMTLAFSSCSSKPKVEAIKLATGAVESTVTTINSGTVEAQNQAELAFGTVGRISKIYVSLGSKVNVGALIAELENADLKAVYDETQKELGRSDELYKNGLVSISNLDSARRAREVARLNYEKTVMKAPFAGMITAMDLKVGEFYQSTPTLNKKPLVQIIDLKKRIIKGEIDEVDLQKVAIGFLARVKIPALKNQIFKAKVTKVVPYVSTAKDQDRTSQIELEIIEAKDDKNQDILIPVGASADVEIISETKERVKILPANVLTGTGKTRFLYKIIKGKLVKKEVKLGLGNYERVEIIEGLADDELVARPLNGVELVDGMKVEANEVKWL
ncbi:MAG: efflux RND transporter periplasmic adaptor subunit [Bacteriovorax sp.]|nr:efflux RND transporter periplasmic adaptor subunit [Bacteriovorax sp.]